MFTGKTSVASFSGAGTGVSDELLLQGTQNTEGFLVSAFLTVVGSWWVFSFIKLLNVITQELQGLCLT